MTHRGFVFDDEDRLGAAGGGPRPGRRLGGDGRTAFRQADLESGAEVRLARHVHEPTVLPDDAEHRRQAEPGAAARFLGREERLEDAGQDIGRNTAAGVDHPQPRVASGADVRIRAFVGAAQRAFQGLDAQTAAARHGVAGVHGEVEQHLVQHAAVGAHRQTHRVQVQLEADVLADDALQHLRGGRHHLVQIEVLRLHHLPPAEEQQLTRQVGATFGAGADLLQALAHVGRQGLDAGRELRLHQHHRQDVVEVVGDAAGELADRLHLLGLAQLRFEGDALGDVGGVGVHHAAVDDGVERPREHALAEALLDGPPLAAVRQAVAHQRGGRGGQHGGGRRQLEIAGQRIGGVVRVGDGARAVELDHRVRVHLREGRQTLHGVFRHLAGRHVGDRGHHVRRAADLDGREPHLDRHLGAVLPAGHEGAGASHRPRRRVFPGLGSMRHVPMPQCLRQQHLDRRPDELVRTIAEHRLGAPVREADAAIGPGHEHGIR